MKFSILSIFLFFTFSFLNAQTEDSNNKLIKYTPSYKFTDGLYLSFNDFKQNLPIEKTKIIAPHLDRTDFNFVATLVEEKTISIYDEMGAEIKINPKQLWGFCSNGNVYININKDFSRLPYIGSLSHLVAEKLVYNQNNSSPYNNNYSYNPYGQATTTNIELRQYLLDMETGTVKDYTLEAVEVALMKDPELHDEFMNLKRKKKRQNMFFYLRKFNDKNPLLVPKR